MNNIDEKYERWIQDLEAAGAHAPASTLYEMHEQGHQIGVPDDELAYVLGVADARAGA